MPFRERAIDRCVATDEFQTTRNQEKPEMIRGIAGAAIAGLVVLIAILGSWYTVDQTERGVLLRNGAVIGTAQPGLGFKVPLIDGVEKISVKTVDLYVGQDELLLPTISNRPI